MPPDRPAVSHSPRSSPITGNVPSTRRPGPGGIGVTSLFQTPRALGPGVFASHRGAAGPGPGAARADEQARIDAATSEILDVHARVRTRETQESSPLRDSLGDSDADADADDADDDGQTTGPLGTPRLTSTHLVTPRSHTPAPIGPGLPPRASQDTIRAFTNAASLARLDPQTRAMGLAYCDQASGPAGSELHTPIHLPMLVFELQKHQELKNLLLDLSKRVQALEEDETAKIVDQEKKQELREWVRETVAVLIIQPDVPAYTASKIGKVALTDTLTIRIWAAMLDKPPEWRERLLPPGFNAKAASKPSNPIHKIVMDIAKAGRQKVQRIVLEAVPKPDDEDRAIFPAVPTSDTMIFNLYEPLGVVAGTVLVREEVLAKISHAARGLYCMMRIHLSLCRWASVSDTTQWIQFDGRLFDLRSKPGSYIHAYKMLCIESDTLAFDGQRNFVQAGDYLATLGQDLNLPTVAQVQARVADLELRWGSLTSLTESEVDALIDTMSCPQND